MNALRTWLDEERGRASKLAADLAVTPAAVSQWADEKLPADRIFTVSAITGIPVKELRPDIIPTSLTGTTA